MASVRNTPIMSIRDRLKTYPLMMVIMVLVNALFAWYPFALEGPELLHNTAKQTDQGWAMGSQGMVHTHLPARFSSAFEKTDYRIRLVVSPSTQHWTGPSRLFSIEESPYRGWLMIGLESSEDQSLLVVRLGGEDAEPLYHQWKFPVHEAPSPWTITVGISKNALTVQVNEQPQEKRQPRDPSVLEPPWSFPAPLTLGNLSTGHRAFAGIIHHVDLITQDQRFDLLEELSWQCPDSYWHWPDRLYATPGSLRAEWIAAFCHFWGFLVLGWLAGRWRPRQIWLWGWGFVVAVAITLNLGKFFVIGRHPSFFDLLLEVSAASLGTYLSLRRDQSESPGSS